MNRLAPPSADDVFLYFKIISMHKNKNDDFPTNLSLLNFGKHCMIGFGMRLFCFSSYCSRKFIDLSDCLQSPNRL